MFSKLGECENPLPFILNKRGKQKQTVPSPTKIKINARQSK